MGSVWFDWLRVCTLGVSTSGNQGGEVFSQWRWGGEVRKSCCDIHTTHMVADSEASEDMMQVDTALIVPRTLCYMHVHTHTCRYKNKQLMIHYNRKTGVKGNYAFPRAQDRQALRVFSNNMTIDIVFQSTFWEQYVWTCSVESEWLCPLTQSTVNRLTQPVCVNIKKRKRDTFIWISVFEHPQTSRWPMK